MRYSGDGSWHTPQALGRVSVWRSILICLVDRAVIEIIGCKFHARVVNRDAPEGRKVSG